MNNNAGVLVFFLVVLVFILVIAVVMVAAFVAVFYFILKANTSRSQAIVGNAVDQWAEEEGYKILSSEQVNRKDDHPFRDRFGFRVRKHGDYGGVVHRITIQDRQGQERSGWLFIPLRGKGGLQIGGRAVFADWQNAEVVWDTA